LKEIIAMSVYLLHFEKPYHHAKHYLGYSPEVQARVNAHLHGKGARLTQVVHDAGIGMVWVRVWEDGDRQLERSLKSWRNGCRHCPICRGEPVQVPLMPWMPAYVPTEAMQEDNGGNQHDAAPPIGPSLFDYAAEADDYAEDMLDREYHARGMW
jgi:predicted GIY-YIG superfamily endonuclease